MRILAGLLLLPSLGQAAAQAATLRPFGTVAGPIVSVADLWDDAGEAAGRALGPSPAPGERIVVEAAQLAAIARQFGVAWRPSSPAERSILERPGAPLAREPVLAALRAAFVSSGAPDGDIELPDWSPPLLPPEAAPRVDVEQVSWDGDRFRGSVAITGRDMTTVRLPVSGRVVVMAGALVATRRLVTGDALRPTDVTAVRLPRDRLRGPAVENLDSVAGQVLRRTLSRDEPVLLADLVPPAAVLKGAPVAIAISSAGVEAVATGEALESGAFGDRIRVMNPASRAVVLAEVTGTGRVRVAPGSLPLRRPAGTLP